MEINKIYNSDWLDNTIEDKSVQLIIADPPYFEVKGEFDFIWESFDDYLKDVEKWAIECKRVLADNGTLFWWGNSKKIAYMQIILDKYFNLENSIIWRKIDSMQYQYYSPDLARTFNTHNERLLLYSNDIDEIDKGCEKTRRLHVFEKNPFKSAIINLRADLNISRDTLGEVVKKHFKNIESSNARISSWELGKAIPSKEVIETINKYFGKTIDYNDLHSRYLDIKNNYEENHRRYFYNPLKLEEALEFSQQSSITKNYHHDTKKPETLTRALIKITSRKNDLVLIPFCGSGTECAMALKEGRNFIGFDIEQKYVDMATKRVIEIIKQPTLDL